MSKDDINNYVPSLLNPRCVRKQDADLSLTQNSIVSRCSLSLKRNNSIITKSLQTCKAATKYEASHKKVTTCDKENVQLNYIPKAKVANCQKPPKPKKTLDLDHDSFGFSAVDDINTVFNTSNYIHSVFSDDLESFPYCKEPNSDVNKTDINELSVECKSSATELISICDEGYDKNDEYEFEDTPTVNVSFGVIDCREVDVTTKNSCLQKVSVSKCLDGLTFDCEVVEHTKVYTESDYDENMNETSPQSELKRPAVSVSLEIKKKKLTPTDDNQGKNKVLILKTNAIEKVSHVILQPPNYKLEKRQISTKYKSRNSKTRRSFSSVSNGGNCDRLKQKSIDSYLLKTKTVINLTDALPANNEKCCKVVVTNSDNVNEMSKTTGFADVSKYERNIRSARSNNCDDSPNSVKLSYRKSYDSPKKEIKCSTSEAQRLVSPRKYESSGSHSASPRRTTDSVQFNLSQRSKPLKTQVTNRSVPHHKIVAGTHFAVDAFSYGEIPNVKHYFLTHFHSDHYAGLRKGFNKLLICSKITADLCMSRLGVSPKCIHIVNLDEAFKIDGVEIMPLDANHCPGAIMLVFTLPNGKTILHTGDFRASPNMESYPVFWNREIHTVYLDTTYCNPRYDFPTQDQSLEMALYILRQKKMSVEQAGKNFSSVLIVCGTYTIGKERFFLGMARRVGCSVWACPEKERVLQVVEGSSFCQSAPESCQLHVVPMRDLTHEKLRCYLDSLGGAFSEVVAFKPSGWENGKHQPIERDHVTLHGIPYSEHSSFSELIRFVKFLKPKQVVPTVDIPGGIKTVQKYFPCPLVCKDDVQSQSKVTDYFSIQGRQQVTAVT